MLLKNVAENLLGCTVLAGGGCTSTYAQEGSSSQSDEQSTQWCLGDVGDTQTHPILAQVLN